MYTDYATDIELGREYLYEEPHERTSDIELQPGINALFLAVWAVISLVGFAVMFLVEQPVAGAIIIAVPTFIGMIIKPTFALCIMMLALPTGAGIGYREVFSLDRGIGIALAVSFLLNILITRPRLRIGNKALWAVAAYTIWVCLASLAGPYLGLELRRAFTQVQLLGLSLIIYWILETNSPATLIWALRAYVVGTLGTIALAYMTGAAITATQETTEGRYAATLGQAINANMLAALTGMAFLAAIYLFARDRNIFARLLYLCGILFLPVMLIRIGSRGNMVALAVTLLSPLLFVREVSRRPTLVLLLVVVIVLASVFAGLTVKSAGLEAGVAERLTSISYAKESIGYRVSLLKQAVGSIARRPLGTGYYSWFERTGLVNFPHSDFFLILGVYGIPGAILFVVFVIMMVRTIRRMPTGLEKLYARAVLTYLLVVGMNNANVFAKFYWVFLVMAMVSERISHLYSTPQDFYYAEGGEEYLPEEGQ
ncbi:MAG: O-antigen ligase family protein [Phycisphaerales bacterium]|nr:MAG: O-antigen ligase family protein [Phycisphaerales bacterium]